MTQRTQVQILAGSQYLSLPSFNSANKNTFQYLASFPGQIINTEVNSTMKHTHLRQSQSSLVMLVNVELPPVLVTKEEKTMIMQGTLIMLSADN